MIPIRVNKLPFNYIGFSFLIFIFIDKTLDKEEYQRTLLHEKLHFYQQLELLFVGMWLLYLVNYAINRVKYDNHDDAYRNIIWELEAEAMNGNPKYLSRRRIWKVFKYL